MQTNQNRQSTVMPQFGSGKKKFKPHDHGNAERVDALLKGIVKPPKILVDGGKKSGLALVSKTVPDIDINTLPTIKLYQLIDGRTSISAKFLGEKQMSIATYMKDGERVPFDFIKEAKSIMKAVPEALAFDLYQAEERARKAAEMHAEWEAKKAKMAKERENFLLWVREVSFNDGPRELIGNNRPMTVTAKDLADAGFKPEIVAVLGSRQVDITSPELFKLVRIKFTLGDKSTFRQMFLDATDLHDQVRIESKTVREKSKVKTGENRTNRPNLIAPKGPGGQNNKHVPTNPKTLAKRAKKLAAANRR